MGHRIEQETVVNDLQRRAEALLKPDATADSSAPQAMQSMIGELIADRLRLKQELAARTEALASITRRLESTLDQIHRIRRTLRSREKKFNAIIACAADGVVTIDQRGRITTFNPAAERMFGYSEEEMLGRNVSALMPAPHRDRHNSYIERYLKTGKSAILGLSREVEGRRKDGSTIPLRLSVIEFSIGPERCFAGTIRDLTEKKRAEREQRARLDELSHVARLSLMGEMASGLAHELNQPLTAIASYLAACRRLVEARRFDKLAPALLNAERQALLAGEIIRRMRAFVKKHQTTMAPTDINALIHEAVGLSESNLRHNGVHIELRLNAPLPAVCADNVQIEQVLLNLIRNSIEAMAETADGTERRLLIETGVSGGAEVQVQVTFRDTGPGLDRRQIDRIFEPFHTTKPKGMGMGLSISRSIVEAHGGHLWVDPDQPGGATFHFTLPLVDDCDRCE